MTAAPLLFLHGYLGQPSMWDDVVRGIDLEIADREFIGKTWFNALQKRNIP